MATARKYDRTSDTLRAIVTVNGRVKADVFFYVKDNPSQILHSDYANISSPDERQAVLARLDEAHRVEAERLLCDLAAEVAAGRVKEGQTASAQEDAEPFAIVEPWTDPVAGADLLEDLTRLLTRYLVLPSHAAEVLALWILHTHVTDVTDYTPYLLVTSPVRECGKSTLLELVAQLAHRAQLTGGITAAALYRRIARWSPTMLLDELDTRLRGDSGEALRGVLNTGFHRQGRVTICVGDDHEDRDFSTFSPKVLAGIGRVWDTVGSRSIPIRLTRASKEQIARLEKVRGDRIHAVTASYRQRLRRWADDSLEELRDHDPDVPASLGARHADVWRPLLAIADVAGGRWPRDARVAAVALHGGADDESDAGLLLLADLRDLFRSRGTESLFTATIVEELVKLEHRPWPEYRKERPITPRGVASLLGRFDVKPQTVRIGAETSKGYKLEDLAPHFRTYLPPPGLSVTSDTSAPEHELAAAKSVTAFDTLSVTPDTVTDENECSVTDSAAANALAGNDVSDVTDRSGGLRVLPGDVVVTEDGSQQFTPEAIERLRSEQRARLEARSEP